jgi:hypothetical protein
VSLIGTKTGEFADGLAINSKNGKAFASDFATQDGDGNELYRVNLNTGDRITDFQLGEDLIGLSGGLDFGSLSISQNGGRTEIAFGEEVLAVLDRVTATDLIASPDSFVII